MTALRIYTKNGDAGETGLFDGTRVSKADPRVRRLRQRGRGLGAAWVGVILAAKPGTELESSSIQIQTRFVRAGSGSWADPATQDREARGQGASRARRHNEAWNAPSMLSRRSCRQLRRFILAGGIPRPARMLHLARTFAGARSAASSARRRPDRSGSH
jgi:cob(I)alamin adenosyltransferase